MPYRACERHKNVNASNTVLLGMNELMGSKDLSDFPSQVWLVQLFRGHAGSGGTMIHQIAIGWESKSEMEAFNDDMYQKKRGKNGLASRARFLRSLIVRASVG